MHKHANANTYQLLTSLKDADKVITRYYSSVIT